VDHTLPQQAADTCGDFALSGTRYDGERSPDDNKPKVARFMTSCVLVMALSSTRRSRRNLISASEGGVAKVIPEPPILEEAYRRVVMRTRLSRPLGKLRAQIGRDVAATVMSDDLLSRVPDNPRAVTGRLRRSAAFLREIGIEVAFGREGQARTRTICIIAAPENTGAQPSAPSASSAFTLNSNSANGLAAPDLRTVASDADGNSGGPFPTVRGGPLKTNGATTADDADANAPVQSGSEKTGTPGWSVRL
jgi:hypothetical protein